MKTKSEKLTEKKIYIFALMVLIGIYLYNFPIQKLRAEKDWTQNEHYILVTYKNDPGRIYEYHYKKNGTVNLIIFNSKWQSIATLYSEPPAKYPRLTE